MCARPISSSRALLRVRTCEPTHRKRLAAGVLAILWAIDLYNVKESPIYQPEKEGAHALH